MQQGLRQHGAMILPWGKLGNGDERALAEWRGIVIQAIKSQNFHMPNGNRVSRKFPLASSLLNLYIAVFQGRFQGITQSKQPRQASSCFLYYSTSSLLSFHPRRIQIYCSQIRTTRPAHQRSSHTKGTYQIITCSISSAPTAPSDIVEIFFSCTTFTFSSLPLSHSSQPLQLHPGLNTYPVADHLLRQQVHAPRNCRHG